MKALICEMCGSGDVCKRDGLFVCASCGTKYSVEDARRMMIEGPVNVVGTVTVDNSQRIINLEKLAKRSLSEKNFLEASGYYHQILLESPDNWEAIFYKGLSSACGALPEHFRLREMQTAAQSALRTLDTRRQQELISRVKQRIAVEIFGVTGYFYSLLKGTESSLQTSEEVEEYWRRLNGCIDVAEYVIQLTNEPKLLQNREVVDVQRKTMKMLVAMYFDLCQPHRISVQTGKSQVTSVRKRCPDLVYSHAVNVSNSYINHIRKFEPQYRPQMIPKRGACYVATCVYGDYDSPEVRILRQFRDRRLLRSAHGRMFVRIYYAIGPSLIRWGGQRRLFRAAVRRTLDPLVQVLRVAGYTDSMESDPLVSIENGSRKR